MKEKKSLSKGKLGGLLATLVVAIGIFIGEDTAGVASWLSEVFDPAPTVQQLSELPTYDGTHQEVIVNNNQPEFTTEELSLANGSWERFSDLDGLNRVGQANAMLSKELFPSEKRERLYVNPTGWNQQKTGNGNDDWLYNRSHLIGYQFTGQNNNLKNLMTGTRSLNSPGMQVYEDQIAKYLKQTGNHVRYRVTPYFVNEELVARGVQMEAQSIEDDEIVLNVYIHNIQTGYRINYQTGRATKEK